MENRNAMPNDRAGLLRRIQAEDFALYEVVLYLDAYPTNKKALAYYEEHKKALAELKAAFVKRYGPLTIYDADDSCEWQWYRGPWPWEKEAN